MIKKLSLPFIGLLLTISAYCQERPFTAGVSVGYIQNGYDAKNQISVSPFALYDDARFYIEGAQAGVYAHKSSDDHIRFGLSYAGNDFEPQDSQNLAQLDKRRTAILADTSYTKITPIGGVRLKLAHDISNTHNGTQLTATHLSRFTYGQATIYPQLGVTWSDKRYNEYYYGVSAKESARSGIQSYTPKDSLSPFVAVSVNYALNDNIAIIASQRLEWLDSTQSDSPMVQDKLASTTRLGLGYRF